VLSRALIVVVVKFQVGSLSSRPKCWHQLSCRRNRIYRVRDARSVEEERKKFLGPCVLLRSRCRATEPPLWNSQPNAVSRLKTLIVVLHHGRISLSRVADDSCPTTTPRVSRAVMLTICRTRGGIYATQNDVRATSVELWLKALGASPSLDHVCTADSNASDAATDLLFERLQKRFDLSKIKAISGAAQVCLPTHR